MSIDARQQAVPTLQSLFSTEFADFDVFYDNGPAPDFSTQQRPFLTVAVDLTDYGAAAIESDPLRRGDGDVVVTAWVRQGEGTADSDRAVLRCAQTLGCRYLGLLTMGDAKIYKARELAGWYGRAVRVPFCYTEKL